MTIDMRIGTGFSSMTSHKRMVTGVISKTVVTLSKNEERIAVKKHKQLISGQTFPLVICKFKSAIKPIDYLFYYSYLISVYGKIIKNTRF